MPITYTHQETKDRIVSFIKTRGPSLPVQIARALNTSPLFASAFLSELYNEGRLLITHMRVGSSPLYLAQGQEAQLEKFIQYLNQKEREAFTLLQKNKLLDDEEQLPAIRVALRAIKDFAIPVKIKSSDQLKLFWKYFLLSDNEVKSILDPQSAQAPAPKLPQPAQPQIQPQIELSTQIPQLASTPQLQLPLSPSQPLLLTPIPEKPKRIPKKKVPEEPSKFQLYVKEYLQTKDVEILEIPIDKKKELNAKIRIDTLFGKQEYILIAKDKKKITLKDLETALKLAQANSMPAVFMSPADLDKKAKEYAKVWRNLVKIEKLNL